MKKFLALLLALMICLTSCSLPLDELIDVDALKELVGSGATEEEVNPDGHTHNFTKIPLNPSCESGGYTLYECKGCKYCYISDRVDALGHKEVVVPGKPATADEPGLTDGSKCSACGKVFTAQTTIPPTGHNYTSTVTSPTCLKGGYTTYTCSDCGDTFTADETSPIPHSEVTVRGKGATCTEDGLTDGKQCSVCLTFTVVQKTIPASGHRWQAATTEAPKTCTVCGVTVGDKLTGDESYTLTVSYIDVGQGDGILIKVGDCDILIDAGYPEYGPTVSSYLKSQNVDDIELMINTHPDGDHCGGLTRVLNDFVVEEVWISKYTNKNTSYYNDFISAVKKEGLTAKQPNKGDVFMYGDLTLTVIYSEKESNANNSSIVVMVEYGTFKFLFTGDIGQDVEAKILSSGTDIKCDVLKVGHHGSKTSSTANFLKATGAEYSVICVGEGNDYGHPKQEALTRLKNAGMSIYRTDLNGTVVFSTDGTTLTLPDGSTDTTRTLPRASTLSTSSAPRTYYCILINIDEYAFCGRKTANYIRKCA